jgi:phosphinothricin acetyltransferase
MIDYKTVGQAMEIKDARLADLPAIVAIYNATVPTRMVTADTQPVSVESRIPWFEQHSSARRPLWSVIEAGQVIGWLSYSSFYGRPAYDGTCELGLYLAPQHQRRGLGSEVLSRAIEHAPTIGVRTLLGFIFAHNEPSLRLAEKHGFAKWGLLPGVAELDGVERDVVIVGRRTEGSA